MAGLRRRFAGTALAPALPALLDAFEARASAGTLRHGDLPRWRAALDALAVGTNPSVRVEGATVVAGRGIEDAGAASGSGRANVDSGGDESCRAALRELHPWRKGPFRIDDVGIDTEWRSDLKWDRLLPHIIPLAERSVLDVGCGSGYHLWRMRAAGAAVVLGIDPTPLYVCQFDAVARYAPGAPVACLPFTLEALADALVPTGRTFDTVFSMGVLYHRADPRTHLERLRALLRPGGELVLETLVPDRSLSRLLGDLELDPGGRYARMRNVHPLPSVARLARLMDQAGFARVRPVSIDITSTREQRRTPWMRFDSLEQALAPRTELSLPPLPPSLSTTPFSPMGSAAPAREDRGARDGLDDPDDPDRLTVEGLPRPVRAVLVARAA